ncbi:hypothetical protein B0H19DRAFT_1386766 [Mycena capillaripes]|nr:hypothetical protein B0H19DRAFT_1386766 [Mycena capillaripes]
MDDEAYADPEIVSISSTGGQESAFYGTRGIFAGSNQFTVAGGNFTSITMNYSSTPTVPSDFRMLPVADIDLQHETHLDTGTGIVDRRRGVRRIYSARVGGQNTTVAMYQGPGAEEEWRQDIAKYMSLRHPNIIQISGAASCGGIHATIFHEELVPFRHFVDLYQHCHFSTVYIYAHCYMEFRTVCEYFLYAYERPVWALDFTLWIRRSTGRLCADLIPSNHDSLLFNHDLTARLSHMQGVSLSNATNTVMVIDTLTTEQYQDICYYDLRQFHPITIPTSMDVHLGAVISWPSGSQLEDTVEIAFLQTTGPYFASWEIQGSPGELRVAREGWTRINSGDIFNRTLKLHRFVRKGQSWLSQASYILSHLKIRSNFEDYLLVHSIEFKITISASTGETPAAFLFLCPENDLQTGPSSFCWPACPAYWSLDPSGVDRLSTEDTTELGLPSLKLHTKVGVISWDASVYAGVRQFHEAKSFDGDSQDVALHLGHPLYQLTNGIDVPFAHVDEEDLCAGEDDEDEASMDLSW